MELSASGRCDVDGALVARAARSTKKGISRHTGLPSRLLCRTPPAVAGVGSRAEPVDGWARVLEAPVRFFIAVSCQYCGHLLVEMEYLLWSSMLPQCWSNTKTAEMTWQVQCRSQQALWFMA